MWKQEWWAYAVSGAVLITYIHLFNAIATMYLDSGRQLQLVDLYRRVVPPMEFTLKM
jgi:hypothetical protein